MLRECRRVCPVRELGPADDHSARPHEVRTRPANSRKAPPAPSAGRVLRFPGQRYRPRSLFHRLTLIAYTTFPIPIVNMNSQKWTQND